VAGRRGESRRLTMFGRKPSPLPLAPGDAAPDFSLSDHTGVVRSLSDYRGRPVVLWFYPKARTPG
jgi:cytochrome oxidase Cu insertion factor (SCO1/SenC/PrrC family)